MNKWFASTRRQSGTGHSGTIARAETCPSAIGRRLGFTQYLADPKRRGGTVVYVLTIVRRNHLFSRHTRMKRWPEPRKQRGTAPWQTGTIPRRHGLRKISPIPQTRT